MEYNFDKIVDRRNTNCLKYDFAVERGKPADVLPLWIADMDFTIPETVTNALIERAKHSVFGYTETKEDYLAAISNWFSTRFGFNINPKWVVKTPGIVYAICMAIRAFTEEKDSVLIQPPVYYPFSESVIINDRKLVNNPLVYENGKYHIDFIDFENKIVDNNVKLFILCSPHNPVGRVWTKEELIKMGDICLKHGVLIVSDEIHCDFVYKDCKHYIFSSINEAFLNNSIVCTSPSKTFNLAGLQISNIFIANDNLRRKFAKEIEKTGHSQLNTMGLLACQCAYESGAEWLTQLSYYLTENLNFAKNFLKENLPQIKIVEPQGTYLLWLDFTSLSLSDKELDELVLHKAKLWVDSGTMFGKEGSGFIRINMACSRQTLLEALTRLKNCM